MELHHNVESSLARTLAALDEVLDKRRRGMHIMELNGYVSTVTLGLRRPPADGITAHEELVTLPDGGTVRLVWRRAGWPGCMRSPQGVVLILPGLNNSSRWPAVQQTAVAFCARGFDTAVLDYRGVAGLKLTSAKIGCLDAWRDLPAVLRVVAGATHPEAPIFAIGFSMGGSILLKHLCAEPGTPIRAAVTVSAPLRLSEHMRRLETGLEWRLVNLAIAAIKKVEILGLHGRDHPALRQVDWRQMVLATRLREIEAAGVCPLHGYATPEDYYAGCQAQLEAVRVPWLCVHARDDPVIHVEPVLAAARALRATEGTQAVFVVTPRGGHLGFAGGSATSWQDEPSWADELAAAFLAHHAGAKPAPVLSRL